MGNKFKTLFLCTGNSCRSQMAEGFLRNMAGDRFEALSAGLEPKDEIHPMAIRVMKEVGIDISGQRPKPGGSFLGREGIMFVIIVCEKAERTCPRIWPGLVDMNRLYWPFDDPACATGSEDEKLEVFRRVRDEIKAKLSEWLKDR